LKAGTASFAKEALLGLSELGGCVHAQYPTGSEGDSFTGFVMVADEQNPSDTLWQRLAATWQLSEQQGHQVLSREVPYSGMVGVVRTDVGLVGASGAADVAELVQRLELLSGIDVAP